MVVRTRSQAKLVANPNSPSSADVASEPRTAASSSPALSSDAHGTVHQAAQGLRYLFGLQAGTRLLTFALGTLLIRALTPDVLGVSRQLEFFWMSILFLARESFRRVSLRTAVVAHKHEHTASSSARTARQGDVSPRCDEQAASADLDVEVGTGPRETVLWSQFVNLAWISVPWGAMVAFISALLWLSAMNEEEHALENYSLSVWSVAFASWLSMLSEPLYIVAEHFLLYRVRVSVEGSAVLLRCVVTYLCVTFLQWRLMAYVCGYFAFAFCMVFGYVLFFFRRTRNTEEPLPHVVSMYSLLPSLDGKNPCCTRTQLALFSTLCWQTIQKLILTRAQDFILKFTQTLSGQGIYSVVDNLGSLVVRFLFQPIEEVSYALFSKLSTSGEQEHIRTSLHTLQSLLKMLIYFGLIFVSFGPSYSYTLLDLLYTSQYSQTDAPLVLSFYCVNILLMAVNGVSEAFVQSSGRRRDLMFGNNMMVLITVIHVATTILTVSYFHTTGLVIANCISMSLRIALSALFIRSFFSEKLPSETLAITSVFPKPLPLLAFIASFACTLSASFYLSGVGSTLTQRLLHVVGGGICFLVTLAVIYWCERPFLSDIRQLWKQKRA